MGVLTCRSCGRSRPDDAGLNLGYRVWCMGCSARFYVLVGPETPPDDGRDWLTDEPEGCLVCGGRLTRMGEPPCDRCGKTETLRS